MSGAPKQQLKDIVNPHQHDVLCGRGGGTNNHVGNELFRQMVNQKKRVYLNSCKRDKPSVSRGIVQAIRKLDPPGRFLQRNETTGMWYDIGDQKAREKTSQALREGAPEIRKSLGGPPPPTNTISWQGPAAPPPSTHDPYYPPRPGYSPAPHNVYPPPPYYNNGPSMYHDPHGRPYSNIKSEPLPDAPPAPYPPPLPSLTPRPGAEGSTLPSHITPEAAKALLQFLKAQQAKAETDPNAASTAIGSHELATALATATNATDGGDAPPSPGRVAAIAAELEALAEARSSSTSAAAPDRVQNRVVTGSANSRPSSGGGHADLAHHIATAAGISPQAANIALQLATRAKDMNALEGERETARQSSRRLREDEYYSRDRTSYVYPSAYDGLRYDPYQQTSRKSMLEGGKTEAAVVSSRSVVEDTKMTPRGEQPPLSTEVERRLAVAEHMAQLARAGARVVTAESAPRQDEEITMLSKKTAMFQNLGILGVKLSVIQNALAKGSSLEELLEASQKSIQSQTPKIKQEAPTESQSVTQAVANMEHTATEEKKDDQSQPVHPTESPKVPEAPRENGVAQQDNGTTEFRQLHLGSAIKSESKPQDPKPTNNSEDSMFPSQMVKSALDAMGADVAVS